ncbi:MAG: hypothetical protein SGJ04_08215 [Bacteroidota bacterium]|nr:hypothetical protein [Bacteroidota bacterium]
MACKYFRILIYIFAIASGPSIKAQTLADSLFSASQFTTAALEYERLLYNKNYANDSIKVNYLERLSVCYIQTQQYDLSIDVLDTIVLALPQVDVNSKDAFLVAKAKLLLAIDKPKTSIKALNLVSANNRSSADYWRGMSFFKMKKLDSAKFYFHNSLPIFQHTKIDSTLNKYRKVIRRNNKGRLTLASILVPGLGQTLAGRPGKGINSLVVVGGITFLVVNTAQIYTGGLAIFVAPWALRYYFGGLEMTRKFAQFNKDKIFDTSWHTLLALEPISIK